MDYYQILGLPPNASESDIKKAYRHLALAWHPDRNPGNEEASRKFKEIKTAYDALIDLTKRAQYNRQTQSKPKEKPVVKSGLYIYDAPPPKYDIWGKPLTQAQKLDWSMNNKAPILKKLKQQNVQDTHNDHFIDSFAGKYEKDDAKDIR